MLKNSLTRWTGLLGLAAFTSQVAAHEGHGAGGTHWHATDVWGFVIVGLLFAGALAWWRGRS